MPSISVNVLKVEPAPKNSLIPHLRIETQWINEANDRVLCCIRCYIYLGQTQEDQIIQEEDLMLTCAQLHIFLEPRNPISYEFYVPINIDMSTALVSRLSVLEKEDIILKFEFTGFCMVLQQAPSIHPRPFKNNMERLVKTYTFPVEMWKRLLSQYYRDIVWVGIKRELYEKLKKLMDEKGLLTPTEAIQFLFSLQEIGQGG